MATLAGLCTFPAAQFLDFEPGILTPNSNAGRRHSINMLKNIQPCQKWSKNMTQWAIVKQWLEIENAPKMIHTRKSHLAAGVYGFESGIGYSPIIDLERRKHATKSLWPLSKSAQLGKKGREFCQNML